MNEGESDGTLREYIKLQNSPESHRTCSAYKSGIQSERRLNIELHGKRARKPPIQPPLHSPGRSTPTPKTPAHRSISEEQQRRAMLAKKRMIRMLFTLVLEFFVCWTPMSILQTWYVFDSLSAVQNVSATLMNMIHLLAYVSSCCNPITYCFMSANFRRGFLSVLSRCCHCGRCEKEQSGTSYSRGEGWSRAGQGENVSRGKDSYL